MAVGFPTKANWAAGDVLTASAMDDLAGTVNLLNPSGNFAAGKNKIINGDFYVNQRGFTSTTSSLTYTFDRWQTVTSGGTATYSAQTFTPGTAPVAGYEGKNFTRIVTTGQSGSTNFTGFQQKIEDVRTLAGQTATISFWAKAASGTPKISIVTEQSFGTGGSPSSVVTTLVGEVTLSTSWVRFSVTGTVPSISGKTIGSAGDSALLIELYVSVGTGLTAYGDQGLQSNTFDIWGVQVEAGSVVTAFQTATGTIQGELAACQRYYFRNTPGAGNSALGNGAATATTNAKIQIKLPVTMRVTPTSLDYVAMYLSDGVSAITGITSYTLGTCNKDVANVAFGVSGGTLAQFRYYDLETLNSTDYIGFSAEL